MEELYGRDLERAKLAEVGTELERMGTKVYGISRFKNYDELRVESQGPGYMGQEDHTYWRIRVNISEYDGFAEYTMDKAAGSPFQDSPSDAYWRSDAHTAKEMYGQLMNKEVCPCQAYYSRENVVEALSDRAGFLIADRAMANSIADSILPEAETEGYMNTLIDSDGVIQQGQKYSKIAPVLEGEWAGTLMLFQYDRETENISFSRVMRSGSDTIYKSMEETFDLKEQQLACAPEIGDMLLLSSALEIGMEPEKAIKVLDPKVLTRSDLERVIPFPQQHRPFIIKASEIKASQEKSKDVDKGDSSGEVGEQSEVLDFRNSRDDSEDIEL